jgi:hypothetical protein
MEYKTFRHTSRSSAESTLDTALSDAQRWIVGRHGTEVFTITHSIAFQDDGRCVALVVVWYR